MDETDDTLAKDLELSVEIASLLAKHGMQDELKIFLLPTEYLLMGWPPQTVGFLTLRAYVEAIVSTNETSRLARFVPAFDEYMLLLEEYAR